MAQGRGADWTTKKVWWLTGVNNKYCALMTAVRIYLPNVNQRQPTIDYLSGADPLLENELKNQHVLEHKLYFVNPASHHFTIRMWGDMLSPGAS